MYIKNTMNRSAPTQTSAIKSRPISSGLYYGTIMGGGTHSTVSM